MIDERTFLRNAAAARADGYYLVCAVCGVGLDPLSPDGLNEPGNPDAHERGCDATETARAAVRDAAASLAERLSRILADVPRFNQDDEGDRRMNTTVEVLLRIELDRPVRDVAEADALAAAIQGAVADLRPAAPGPENGGYPGVASAEVIDWTEQPPAKRDASAAELREEPDATLQMMAQGELGATPTTQQLARAELDYRRLRQ